MAGLSKNTIKAGKTGLALAIAIIGIALFIIAITDNSYAEDTDTTKENLSKAVITCKDKTYTGKKVTPIPVVKINNKTLKVNTDYVVRYINNRNIGTATIIIKGTNEYLGTAKGNFRILPKGISKVSLSSGLNQITTKWKTKDALKGKNKINGYQVRYSRSKNMTGAKSKAIGKVKATSLKIKGLAFGATYYLQVRTYKKVGKKYYCSKWSAMKSKTTIDKNSYYMARFVGFLNAKNWRHAKLANSKLSKYASEKCVKNMSENMKSAFINTVLKYDSKHGQESYFDYYLTDFDNDKKAELIIQTGDCTADQRCLLYDYTGGKAACKGIWGASNQILSAYPNHNGVISEYCHMGYCEIYQYYYSAKGGKNHVKKKTLYTFKNVFKSSASYPNIRLKLKSHVKYNSDYSYKIVDYSPF